MLRDGSHAIKGTVFQSVIERFLVRSRSDIAPTTRSQKVSITYRFDSCPLNRRRVFPSPHRRQPSISTDLPSWTLRVDGTQHRVAFRVAPCTQHHGFEVRSREHGPRVITVHGWVCPVRGRSTFARPSCSFQERHWGQCPPRLFHTPEVIPCSFFI